MLAQELHSLIEDIILEKTDRQRVELRCDGYWATEKLYTVLSAFANQAGGGTIVFGVDPRNSTRIVGVRDAAAIHDQVMTAAHQLEPAAEAFFTETVYNGMTVISAEISECEPEKKPCYYKPAGRASGAFERIGGECVAMSEFEVYCFDAYRNKIRDELRVVERTKLKDINREQLAAYFAKLRAEKPRLVKNDAARVMQLQGIAEEEQLTMGGLMLLGDYPQGYFPQMGIIATAVAGTQRIGPDDFPNEITDSRRFEGSIRQMLNDAMAFVRRNMKNVVNKDSKGLRTGRPEYPLPAVRELLLNAMIHRDYSVYTEDAPITLTMYSDRLVVENPGGLFGTMTIGELGKSHPDRRNPYIAGNIEVLLGKSAAISGIPLVCAEMRKAGLKPPVFESARGQFRATLYNSPAPDGKAEEPTVSERILEFCDTPKSKDEIADLLEINTSYYVVTKYLHPLVKAGTLAMTHPDKPKSKFQKFYRI